MFSSDNPSLSPFPCPRSAFRTKNEKGRRLLISALSLGFPPSVLIADRNLNGPRQIPRRCAGDAHKVHIRYVEANRKTVLDMIESIEHVSPNHQAVTFPRHVEPLGDAKVHILDPVGEKRVTPQQWKVGAEIRIVKRTES